MDEVNGQTREMDSIQAIRENPSDYFEQFKLERFGLAVPTIAPS